MGLLTRLTDTLGLTDSKSGLDNIRNAEQLQAEILKRLEGIDLPNYANIRQQIMSMEAPELVGLLEAEELGETALADIDVDPRLREAQMGALSQLSELGRTGLGEQDRAAFEELAEQTAGQERARQSSILQQMAQRGAIDSGAQLAAQLVSSQAAAQEQARQARDMAGQAAQARQQAVARAGQMGGNIRQQEFGEQARVAQARDVIDRFNVGQRMGVQQANLGSRQQQADAATNLRNQQRMSISDLERQKFQDDITKTTGATNQLGQQAGFQYQIGQGRQAGEAQKMGAVLQGGATAASLLAMSDRDIKKKIKNYDSEETLDKLSDYEYEYKEPHKEGQGAGRFAGVMAQDLEKLDGDYIIEKDGKKYVDYGKMAGMMLANQVDINERLKKLEG